MHPITIAGIIAIVTVFGSGCRTEPVLNVRAPLTAPVGGDANGMPEVLTLGAERCGWRVRDAGPGRLRAERIVASHRAVIEIAYDLAGYNVTLLQADNLLYDGRKVHKAYNSWVKKLQKCIEDESTFRGP